MFCLCAKLIGNTLFLKEVNQRRYYFLYMYTFPSLEETKDVLDENDPNF